MTMNTNRPLCAVSEEEQEALMKEAAALMMLRQGKSRTVRWSTRFQEWFKPLLNRNSRRQKSLNPDEPSEEVL